MSVLANSSTVGLLVVFVGAAPLNNEFCRFGPFMTLQIRGSCLDLEYRFFCCGAGS